MKYDILYENWRQYLNEVMVDPAETGGADAARMSAGGYTNVGHAKAYRKEMGDYWQSLAETWNDNIAWLMGKLPTFRPPETPQETMFNAIFSAAFLVGGPVIGKVLGGVLKLFWVSGKGMFWLVMKLLRKTPEYAAVNAALVFKAFLMAARKKAEALVKALGSNNPRGVVNVIKTFLQIGAPVAAMNLETANIVMKRPRRII
jgi:hypothetical protein